MTASPTPVAVSYTRPFPALTASQRYHLDLFGYVVVPNVLTADECGRMRDDLQRLKRDLHAIPEPANRMIEQAYFSIDQPHHAYLGAIGQTKSYPAILDYIAHPRIVGMAEELVGGKVHILEANAHINSKAPTWSTNPDGTPVYGFHRGLNPEEGHHYHGGLYHSSFVKVLTNLTDLGPDDGGTVVVAGSHKIDVGDDAAILAAAYEDPSLIHQVIAPAGSSLLFTEALLHATGQIRSDRERVIIIAGFGTTYFPFRFMESHRADFAVDQNFINAIPDQARYLWESKGYIQRDRRHRKLSDPVDKKEHAKLDWETITKAAKAE